MKKEGGAGDLVRAENSRENTRTNNTGETSE